MEETHKQLQKEQNNFDLANKILSDGDLSVLTDKNKKDVLIALVTIRNEARAADDEDLINSSNLLIQAISDQINPPPPKINMLNHKNSYKKTLKTQQKNENNDNCSLAESDYTYINDIIEKILSDTCSIDDIPENSKYFALKLIKERENKESLDGHYQTAKNLQKLYNAINTKCLINQTKQNQSKAHELELKIDRLDCRISELEKQREQEICFLEQIMEQEIMAQNIRLEENEKEAYKMLPSEDAPQFTKNSMHLQDLKETEKNLLNKNHYQSAICVHKEIEKTERTEMIKNKEKVLATYERTLNKLISKSNISKENIENRWDLKFKATAQRYQILIDRITHTKNILLNNQSKQIFSL